MADNHNEVKASDPVAASTSAEAPEIGNAAQEAKDDELTTAPADDMMNPDQSFVYWLVMTPFLVFAGTCLYSFIQNSSTFTQLWNAIGAVIVGVFAASFVNVLAGDKSGQVTDEQNPDAANPTANP